VIQSRQEDQEQFYQAESVLDPSHVEWLKEVYFSDPDRCITLEEGDPLLCEGQPNNKLYFVLSGELRGYLHDPNGATYDLFSAGPGQFIGLLSFFSRKLMSHSNVVAAKASVLAYIESDQAAAPHDTAKSLFDQFLPVVISNLAYRRQQEQRLAWEKESALRNLVVSEKRASLGQMAAGIAHELNNAVAVLERNTEWLSSVFLKLAAQESALVNDSFVYGLKNGRSISSSDARKRAKELVAGFSMPKSEARHFSETGFDDSVVKELLAQGQEQRQRALEYWEIGATIHTSSLASRHATHVVKSVKVLGASHSEPEAGLDLNETIEEAMALLRSQLRSVKVTTHFGELSPMRLNSGEMVQVWLNLIRNAVESLEIAGTNEPEIVVSSEDHAQHITVQIQDNGPGISKELQDKVFQPNFSTKEKGLTFGLGLGLTICSSIVSNYNGKMLLNSKPGCTVFSVQLPKRGREG
jgi:hypothetical protein